MAERYKHTQVGYVTTGGLIAGAVLVGVILADTSLNSILIGVLVIIGIFIIMFSSLTVIIRGDYLEVRFGFGPIRKRYKLNEIESAQAVRNKWYYFWGIRLTPYGWLYTVSGLHAVEIKLKTGKTFRIGTDNPQELEEAIQQAI